MALADLVKRAQRLASENSPAILTAAGITGTITTAILTGRASFKAAELIERDLVHQDISAGPLEKREIVLYVWKLYIPAVVVGSGTISCIIFANRLNSRQAAAMAAAYSISERAFSEYKDKVVEKLGSTKERAIRDEIAQDRVTANPVKEVIITDGGEVLFMDSITGRYFMSTVETCKAARNTLNLDISGNMYASLSQFYEEIGLSPTTYSDEVGWNIDNHCEISFSTCMSSDNRPCIVLDFNVSPLGAYRNLY